MNTYIISSLFKNKLSIIYPNLTKISTHIRKDLVTDIVKKLINANMNNETRVRSSELNKLMDDTVLISPTVTRNIIN